MIAPSGSRLPALGPSGEGWVAGQFVLLGLVAVAGLPGLADLPPATGGRWLLFNSSLTVVLAVALWTTIDLDNPRAGLLRLSDAPLRELAFDAPRDGDKP